MGRSIKRKTADELWRASWSYDDELRSLQGDQILIETIREAQTNGFFKNALADRDSKISSLGLDRAGTNWLRNHMQNDVDMMVDMGSVQSLKSVVDRVMTVQAVREIASAAIAVKRYQLR